MLRHSFLVEGLLLATALLSTPTLASDDDSDGLQGEAVPTVLIGRVPAVGDAQDIRDQRTDTDIDVFSLAVKFKRLADGKLDLEDIRAQILDLMSRTDPVTVGIKLPDQALAALPDDLKQKFHEAEADSVAAYGDGEAVVAWRGYGPVRGYSRGVVAFGSTRYRGYYPYATEARYGVNPYLGYYANGRSYPFTYGIHRHTPSYHYFLYHRYY